MIDTHQTVVEHKEIVIHNLLPEPDTDDTVDSVLQGLTRRRPQISCVHFYDSLGSKLFEEITSLPEYYLTRTEKPLITDAARILAPTLSNMEIVELGSGDCSKISLLFQEIPGAQLAGLTYRPIDVSISAVEESARQLIGLFPGIAVDATITDFITQITTLPRSNRSRLFCFFGSTLGNLDREMQEEFLIDLGHAMSPGDKLLIGVDMVKSQTVLENAYNDKRGITDQFNRNVLTVVNRIAGTNFVPARFDHLAFYNEPLARIEMHLRAQSDQVVHSPHLNNALRIREGETIHTENSHKFTPQMIARLSRRAGLETHQRFTDDENWFSLFYLQKP